MPLDATGLSGYVNYLVEITLDSTVLRYGFEDASVLTKVEETWSGAFYEGRIKSASALSRDLGTFLESREQIGTLALELDNSDGSIGTKLYNATIANKAVDVYVGEGYWKDGYTKVYVGAIDFPGGVEWNDEKATINIVDKRVKHRRILPLSEQVYKKENYPNIEKRALTEPIPIVYGNWASNAASGCSVPCVCIDTTIPKFKIAGHGIKSIDRYIQNAAVVSPSNIANVSLAAATFEFDGLTYDATSDTVSVNCQGIQTVNGTLIESPGGIYRNILTAYLGLTTSDFFEIAFTQLESETSGLVCRRYIDTQTESDVLIQQLMNECEIDTRFQYGLYSPKYRSLTNLSAPKDIHVGDILTEQNGEVADFTIQLDPDRLYTNKVAARYQYDPVDAQFLSATTISNATAMTRDQGTYERQMDFMWMWDKADIEPRINREISLFSEQPVFIEAKLGRRAILLNPADQIEVTYGPFVNENFQIRRIDSDFQNLSCRITAYNIFAT